MKTSRSKQPQTPEEMWVWGKRQAESEIYVLAYRIEQLLQAIKFFDQALDSGHS